MPSAAFARAVDGAYHFTMLLDAVAFGAGLGCWTFLEYLIHGPLSHQFATIISRFHVTHHRDPRAVFTVRAWIPVSAITVAALAIFGFAPGMIFYLGVIAGFVGYEIIHYRIHFVRPRTAIAHRLRSRHLAHHLCDTNAIFGVSTRLWDVAFGTEPAPSRMRELERAVAHVRPLTGPSNWRRV